MHVSAVPCCSWPVRNWCVSRAAQAFVSPALAAASGWLVSSSKDALVKVWDMDTQHCCQTLTGHKGEVWALDVSPSEARLVTGGACGRNGGAAVMHALRSPSSSSGLLLAAPTSRLHVPPCSPHAAGSTDHELRVFAIDATSATAPAGAAGGRDGSAEGRVEGSGGRAPLLRAMGSVKRQAGTHDRVAALRFNKEGTLLACQGAGKSMELFRWAACDARGNCHTG